MPSFHFWLARPIMGLPVGQLRMTDIYSNFRPYWTALALVMKIQVYASIKQESFINSRRVLHQYSSLFCASFIFFLVFFLKDLIEFMNIASDFQRSTREIQTRLLLEITASENQSSYPGSDPTYKLFPFPEKSLS